MTFKFITPIMNHGVVKQLDLEDPGRSNFRSYAVLQLSYVFISYSVNIDTEISKKNYFIILFLSI